MVLCTANIFQSEELLFNFVYGIFSLRKLSLYVNIITFLNLLFDLHFILLKEAFPTPGS